MDKFDIGSDKQMQDPASWLVNWTISKYSYTIQLLLNYLKNVIDKALMN